MFGEITNSELLNGWKLNLESANKLPQVVASAFGNIFGDYVGGSYTPVYYVGTQQVNGVNHKLIAQRTMLTSGGKTVKSFAVVTINIPPGDVRGEKATKVSEESAVDFVLRDNIEKGFKRAMADLLGTDNKPILELGTQVVKGTNYVFICESKEVYPGAEPYLTRIVVNNFQNYWTVVEVEKI